ncbi:MULTISPECIES: His-Xaa-Ser system protein HxsD [Bacteroides]|uniref:His-Xaa-Ser system protein HxsD n=1 Tax=Bacteroides TaxID=816 RepID=UPI00138F985A|nr:MULTISPECIES: His-Xaa-Ser system protein HxsD [Bacteroides]NDO59434.1 His-Xaa-Ser system protein HxsD [Bacteroides caecimuris]
MAEIKIPIVKLTADKFQVSVDTSLYAKEVITAAIYKFSHLFYIHQQTDVCNQIIVNVCFESKDNSKVTEDIPKLFCNELIDQQIRYNTNAQFGHIRDMIVQEAFKPVTK